MADIKIIEREPDSRILSREEREARLNEIAINSEIPKYHFDNFLELEDSVLSTDSKRLKPDITALLIRKLLTYDAVIPIVIDKVNKLKTSDNIYEYFDIPALRKFGSADKKSPKIKKPIKVAQPIKEIDTNVKKPSSTQTVQINGRKKFIHLEDVAKFSPLENKYLYQTTNNETIQVSGLYINQYSPMVKYFRDQYPWSMNVFSCIMSGAYSVEYLHNKLFSPYHVTSEKLFMDNMRDFMPGGIEIMRKNSGEIAMYYVFKDDEQTKNICTSLFEYIQYLERIWAPRYQSSVITKAFKYSENIVDHPKSAMPKFSELFKLIVTMLTRFQDLSTTVETKNVPIEIDAKIIEFVKQVDKFMTRHRPIKYESSLHHDLWIGDMFHLFEKFIAGQNDSNLAKNGFAELKEMIVNRNKDELADAQSYIKQTHDFAVMFTEMSHRWIYIQKFGWEKFETLYKPPPGIYDYKRMLSGVPIMSLIPKDTKSILDIEYQRIEKYTDSLYKNTCPHIAVEAEMRAAPSAVAIHKYAALKKFMPANEQSISKGENVPHSMITCTNCKFPLICPHLRDLYEMEKVRKTDEEIREFITKYAGKTSIDQHFYCRICGEPIADSTEYEGIIQIGEGQLDDYHYADDELRDFIWQEASNLVRNFTETKGLQTNKVTNKFIGTIVSNIYEFVFAIEKKLIKAKTSSLEEIQNKKKIFTVIYVMALLVKIINENQAKIKFSSKKKGDGNSFEKVSIGKLLGQAYNIIIGSQNVLISRIDGMSNTVVQNSLLKAYKVIGSLLGKSTMPQVQEEEIITTLLLDPLYQYIISAHVHIRSADMASSQKAAPFRKMKDSFIDPKVSLGKDIKAIEKSEYFYDGISVPKFEKGLTDGFDELVEKGLSSKELFTKGGLYEGYWIRSFLHTFEYIHSRMYIHPLWKVNILEDAAETLHIEINKPYQEYFAKYEKLSHAERILFDLMLYYKMKSYQRLPFKKNNDFILEANPEKYLAQTYGDKLNTKFSFKSLGFDEPSRVGFHVHKWDIVAYDVGKTKKAFRLKDINKKLEQEVGSKDTWYVEDVYCSVCYHAKSQVTDVYERDKINPVHLLEQEQFIESFYNFYANLCPAASGKVGDNLHVFSADGTKCSKCQYEKVFTSDKNKTYFHKWEATFKKDTAAEAEQDRLLDNLDDLATDWSKSEIPTSIKNPKIGDDVKKWKYNPNIITELANTTFDIFSKSKITKNVKNIKKINYYNILVNLGLSQGLDFDELLSGKATPYRDMSFLLSKIRENQVGTYIYTLMIEYNMMRNYKNLAVISPDLKEIVSSAPLLKVIDKLPDFTNDFIVGYNQMKRLYYNDEDAIHLSNFVMEFLCKTLLKIYKAAKETAPFLAYFINKLFDAERTLSKPKDNKMAQILANTKTDDTAIMQDDSVSDAFNTVSGPDKMPEGYSDMDYDGSNDKVGEGNADDTSI